LATTVVAPSPGSTAAANQHRLSQTTFGACLVTALTALALAVHGYHPYVEDGGLYVAGIKRLLDPTMYPHQTGFVLEHLRFSIFAPFVAGMVRSSGLSLELVLLLLQCASFWLTLFAAWKLAQRCYDSRELQAGAVTLLAVWLALPIAGTSLMLMDPYVTARSISTPCSLFALAGALEFLLPSSQTRGRRRRGLTLCCVSLLIAALFHPLMAGYSAACIVVLACIALSEPRLRGRWMAAALLAGVALAAAVHGLSTMDSPEDAAYLQVAMTRGYWFISQWQWYEWVGLAAPLAILGWVAKARSQEGDEAGEALAQMGLVVGSAAVMIAVLFARPGSASHLVARLQPLRVFQIVYVLMIIALGAELVDRILWRRAKRWATAFALLGAVMVIAERQTFPASAHIELPAELKRSTEENEWVQAFLWIKRSTPKDALFAMDADYITRPGEDAQCFRAVAERSALPDYSKDGGEASITPELTTAWTEGQSAQAGLSGSTDAKRMATLAPLGVNWIVLQRDATTGFACDYSNDAVKVCRLPGGLNRRQ
jgi:hypothetical protein